MRLPARNFRLRPDQSVANPFFSLKVRGNELGRNRIGIIVGTAVHKSAVKRNFFRRLAGEALRTSKKNYGDLLMIIAPKANALTKKQFREKLLAALHQVK